MTELITERKITTSDLTHRIFAKFADPEATNDKYIVATQVRPDPAGSDGAADAIVVSNWRSAGSFIQGFEVKISRSDWLNEVKDPKKCEPNKKFCHYWWLVITDESMVKEGELPDDWGMMVADRGHLKIIKKAPLLTPVSPDVPFIAGLMRANKRNHVPEDLHNQYIQDARREIEARTKKEHEELHKFIKEIHLAFGIKLEQEKSYDYNVRKDIKRWVAKVGHRHRSMNPEELAELIKSVLTNDFKWVKAELAEALVNINDAKEILQKYEGISKYRD